MTFLTSVEYRGSTGTPVDFYVQANATNSAVGQAFANQINTIDELFKTVPYDPVTTIDTGKAQSIELALEELLRIAKDGVTVSGRLYYLTSGMAESLSLLVDTFNMSGAAIDVNANPPTVTLSVAALKQWYNLSHSSMVIGEILNKAKLASLYELSDFVPFIGSDGKPIYSTSLQAFVELIYVKQGNEVFSDVIESLEGALTTTKEALDLLADLQALKNQVQTQDNLARSTTAQTVGATIPATGEMTAADQAQLYAAHFANAFTNFDILGTAPWDSKYSETQFLTGYQAIGQDRYVNQDLYPVPNSAFGFEDTGSSFEPKSALTNAIAEFDRIRGALSALLPRLASQTVGSPNINSTAIQDSTLLAKLKKVFEDMNTAISATGEAVGDNMTKPVFLPFPPWNLQLATVASHGQGAVALWYWLIDDKAPGLNVFDKGGGSVQQNIQVATTAGQNLNDTQKELVRKNLVLFEEYYKSAAAILSKLTQIIEKMAQGIAR